MSASAKKPSDRRHPPKTRVVGYEINATFDESAMEGLLHNAVMKGIVTQFDTGRGSFCWFNGPPGKELRAVKKAADDIAAMGESRLAVQRRRGGSMRGRGRGGTRIDTGGMRLTMRVPNK